MAIGVSIHDALKEKNQTRIRCSLYSTRNIIQSIDMTSNFVVATLKNEKVGIPWRSSGWDSVLPLRGGGGGGAWVQSLFGELGSRELCGTAKKIK